MRESVLLTGFESFDGNRDNMSSKILSKVPLEVSGLIIKKLILPVIYQTAGEIVVDFMNKYSVDYVVMLGEANIKDVRLEKYASNMRNSGKVDNNGNVIRNQKIIYDGPARIPTNFKIEDFAKQNDLKVSLSAGSFVCNDVFYQTAYKSCLEDKKFEFIHVPSDAQYLDNATKQVIKFLKWIPEHE